MRNITQLAVSLALLATQVNVPKLGFDNLAAADTSVSAPAATVYEVNLNTGSTTPVQLVTAQPDYNTQVLVPLEADQAAEAAAAKAKAAAEAQLVAERAVARPVIAAGSDVWASLRYCEAGGNYTRNSGNGYYGAYQFSLSTWADYDGYVRPDLAPPAVQDAKAKATEAARGWAPWPACARKLGLL
jgi:transglycosylase-like protein